MSDYKPDQLLDHSDEADGILEYDNRLPRWWVWLFIGTVVWAFGYGVYRHLAFDWSQEIAYNNEVAAALVQWPPPSEESLAVVDDAAIQAGEAIYQVNCVACHGAELKGGIGPSLIDAEWKYGSDLAGIRKTVGEGVAAAGMPAWDAILGPQKVAQVSAFVQSRSGD